VYFAKVFSFIYFFFFPRNDRMMRSVRSSRSNWLRFLHFIYFLRPKRINRFFSLQPNGFVSIDISDLCAYLTKPQNKTKIKTKWRKGNCHNAGFCFFIFLKIPRDKSNFCIYSNTGALSWSFQADLASYRHQIFAFPIRSSLESRRKWTKRVNWPFHWVFHFLLFLSSILFPLFFFLSFYLFIYFNKYSIKYRLTVIMNVQLKSKGGIRHQTSHQKILVFLPVVWKQWSKGHQGPSGPSRNALHIAVLGCIHR
jgi:hypothetical protein